MFYEKYMILKPVENNFRQQSDINRNFCVKLRKYVFHVFILQTSNDIYPRRHLSNKVKCCKNMHRHHVIESLMILMESKEKKQIIFYQIFLMEKFNFVTLNRITKSNRIFVESTDKYISKRMVSYVLLFRCVLHPKKGSTNTF